MDNYEIIVQGHLEKRRLRDMEGIQLELLSTGETKIICNAIDQAALHGIIAKIRDLGLQLHAVKIIK